MPSPIFRTASLQQGRAPLSAEVTVRSGACRVGGALQQGRAPLSAEVCSPTLFRDGLTLLQQGRAPLSAEVLTPSRPRARRTSSFNRAALL